MKVRILPSAVADLDHGREFYARQRDSLGDYHRLLSKRFPFAVYYRMMDGDVCIVWCALEALKPGR